MSIFILYLLLLKATVTSFSGLASLPVVRNDLVVHRQLITDHQLNAAVVVGRSTPGPAGLYIVSVGYFAAGIPGAIAGWLALITPALLIIPMLHYLGKKAERPWVKRVLHAIVLASAGLLLSATLPLAKDAISGMMLAVIAVMSCILLITTRLDTIWIILGAASLSLAGASFHLIAALS